jgi:GTP pyrophosphokinase
MTPVSTSSSALVLSDALRRDGVPITPRIEAAIRKVESLYAGKQHWSGVMLLEHVQDVMRELVPFEPDEDTFIACLLHHVLESKEMTVQELEEEFGSTIRSLVAGVQMLSQVKLQDARQSIDTLRLMLLSVSDDIRVLLIILCDRVSLLGHMTGMRDEDRKWFCENILYLFAPVAARLGIHALKQRMESAAFPVLYPTDATHIAEQLQDLHGQTGDFLLVAAKYIEQALQAEQLHASVQGREKLPYSIFTKMRAKSFSHVSQVHDLFALRVIVETETDCYRALGILHKLGRPIANRFKDYIGFPKPNGYRSLHTTMMRLSGVPEGVFLEVQVRTQAMHREAEYGIAAHWRYKERGSSERVEDRKQLQEALTGQYAVTQGEGGHQALVDHIFVLTPTGDIVELPEGATPLDFAFQIHTQLGLSFKAARVNGSIVPLNHELENGDIIEIIRHKYPQPSPEWLTSVRMASSRARLRRYLASQHRSAYIVRGREMVNEELRKHQLPLLDADYSLLRHVYDQELDTEERENLLMRIAQGHEKLSSVLPQVHQLQGLWSKPVQKKSRSSPDATADIIVDEGMPMPMRHAKCCKPDNQALIVGIVSRTGLVIHKQHCRMIKQVDSAGRISVRWAAGL